MKFAGISTGALRCVMQHRISGIRLWMREVFCNAEPPSDFLGPVDGRGRKMLG